jgi:hypothetical protein
MEPTKSDPDEHVHEYAGRSLPGPNYRLTGSLAKARDRDRERIEALKRSSQENEERALVTPISETA